jgi:hypothetical protein
LERCCNDILHKWIAGNRSACCGKI